MDVEEIFPGVFELRTTYGRDTAGLFTEGAFPHAVWFVAGPTPALMDPGPTVVAQETLETLSGMGYDPNDIEYVVPSHIHIDHGGGCGWLVKELPKAKAVIHSRGAPFMLDVSRLIAGTAAVFGEDWEGIFGDLSPVPEDRLVAVEDGSILELGGKTHRIVFMPGHSLDHMGVYDETNQALYCGHGLGNYKPERFMPDPPMTLPYFDVEASLASIRKARDLAPRYLLPVHSGFLASNPDFAIDAVERVTIAVGDIVKAGMEAGATPEAIEDEVKTYLFAKPAKADRSYMPVVRAYMTYYERLQRRSSGA
jgi:glyoxylase-like metal-dependent hydrolase (beta-lactamase superfamily II)